VGLEVGDLPFDPVGLSAVTWAAFGLFCRTCEHVVHAPATTAAGIYGGVLLNPNVLAAREGGRRC